MTTHFPCTTCSPASMISHLELSIIMGTLEISGSATIRFKNLTMASFPSIKPSSILISMIWAPPSTWCRATSKASSNFSSFMSRRNFFDPATLVRSPTLMKLLSWVITKGSRPDNFRKRPPPPPKGEPKLFDGFFKLGFDIFLISNPYLH